jgi:hypothetical protein
VVQINTVASLRIAVFVLWVAFAILLSIVPCGLLFRPRAIDTKTVFELIKLLAGLWVPALSCFSAFWFSEGNERGAQETPPNQGQKVGSLALTFLYFGICILTVSLTLFVQPYDYDPTTNEPIGPLVDQQVAGVVSWLQLLSPVLLAPIGFLTGKVPTPNRIASNNHD